LQLPATRYMLQLPATRYMLQLPATRYMLQLPATRYMLQLTVVVFLFQSIFAPFGLQTGGSFHSCAVKIKVHLSNAGISTFACFRWTVYPKVKKINHF